MCAVVANKEIGSVPYLIKNGKSGLIYNRKKKGDLTKKVKSLLDDKEYKKSLQLGAYQTLTNVWNAEEAADRLLNLVDDINNNNEPRYLDGPCSRD
jgi:spore maturation protein CgeB